MGFNSGLKALTHCSSNRCPGTTTSPGLNFCLPGISDWLGYELQGRGNVVRLPIRTEHSLKYLDLLWSSQSFLPKGYWRDALPGGEAAGP
jgi:hypothetical protein